LAEWRTRAQTHGLIVIAELLSSLTGDDQLQTDLPLITGTVVGLARGKQVNGPILTILCERLASLFKYSQTELREIHSRNAPVELVIDLDRMESIFGFAPPSTRWEPGYLSILLERLPTAPALALYGRAPGWVFATAALNAQPAVIYHFDARLGWVKPVTIHIDSEQFSPLLDWEVQRHESYTWLEITRKEEYYLDYDEIDALTVPSVTSDVGLVLSGAIPNWLLLGLALSYQPHVPWIATFYPQLQQAVVVASRSPHYQPGKLISGAL